MFLELLFNKVVENHTWKMFESSNEEVHKLLEDNTDIEINDSSVVIFSYPFEPSIVYPNKIILPCEIIDIDSSAFPPTIHLKEELVFLTFRHKEKLKEFAEKFGITDIKRPDIWGWILEPFLDTELSEIQSQNIYYLLLEFGMNKFEVDKIRREIEVQMLKYNFDTMLWDWCSFGAKDVLKAMRPTLSKAEYEIFYKKVMQIAFAIKAD